MVNQEAYFYGLSGVMEERIQFMLLIMKKNSTKWNLNFGVFILIKRSKVFYCIKELEDHSY